MGRKHTYRLIDTGKRKEAGTSNSSPTISSEYLEQESDVIENKNRGPTLMCDIWELEDGWKVQVSVGIGGIPIGVEASTLANFVGTVVRRSALAPIHYNEWRQLGQTFKDAIWQAIEEKFEFQPSCEETKKYVMTKARDKWRGWKNDLKSKVFDKKKTPEQMWEEVNDDRVNKEQFLTLSQIWLSDDHQKICEQNKRNREKLEDPHCNGSKTFARIIQEKKQKVGRTPTRADIYISSRTHKNGIPVNEKAKGLMDLMVAQQTNDVSESASFWEGDSFSKVKGPETKGRVRCIGSINPSQTLKSKDDSENNVQEAMNGIVGLFVGMVDMMKQKFPDSNFDHVITTAKDLAEKVVGGAKKVGGKGKKEFSCSSVPSNTRVDMGSSYEEGSCNVPSGSHLKKKGPSSSHKP